MLGHLWRARVELLAPARIARNRCRPFARAAGFACFACSANAGARKTDRAGVWERSDASATAERARNRTDPGCSHRVRSGLDRALFQRGKTVRLRRSGPHHSFQRRQDKPWATPALLQQVVALGFDRSKLGSDRMLTVLWCTLQTTSGAWEESQQRCAHRSAPDVSDHLAALTRKTRL